MKKGKGPRPAAVVLGTVLFLAAGSCRFAGSDRITASETDQIVNEPAAPPTNDYSAKPVSDFAANPFCRACHLDFEEEKLAKDHESAGIGCERCHGESLRHRSDEANVTPPELMYPKQRINPTCMMCHPRHTISRVKDHQPILEAGRSIFEEMPSPEDGKNYCTDCHAVKHRMQNRTVRWNKATGESVR